MKKKLVSIFFGCMVTLIFISVFSRPIFRIIDPVFNIIDPIVASENFYLKNYSTMLCLELKNEYQKVTNIINSYVVFQSSFKNLLDKKKMGIVDGDSSTYPKTYRYNLRLLDDVLLSSKEHILNSAEKLKNCI